MEKPLLGLSKMIAQPPAQQESRPNTFKRIYIVIAGMNTKCIFACQTNLHFNILLDLFCLTFVYTF